MGQSDDLLANDLASCHTEHRSPWRRRLPALVMITVLALAATVVWTDLLVEDESGTGGVSCPPGPREADLTPLPYQALRHVAPLPPGKVAVLVRNSTNVRGLAARVTARLELNGFTEAAPPDNDPVYPTGTLHCTGQIRFGAGGDSAARSVSLMAPCAQLIRDERSDRTVDLVLGTRFTTLSPTRQAREVLRNLRESETKQPPGGLQSLPDTAAALPRPAITGARPASC